jgi:hypothetical protein
MLRCKKSKTENKNGGMELKKSLTPNKSVCLNRKVVRRLVDPAWDPLVLF